MAFIKKSKISSYHRGRMKSVSGYREKQIMKKANLVYTSEKGRCINFLDTRTGNRCQYDKYSGYYTN